MSREEPLREIVRRAAPLGVRAGIDLIQGARVFVTSEQSLFPVDNVFDEQRGPGGSCWIAGQSGEQALVIALTEPVSLKEIVIESEQHGGLARQEIDLAVWDDRDGEFHELGTRGFTFRPYGPSFQTETWDLGSKLVSRLRLRITPEGETARACLTSIVVRR